MSIMYIHVRQPIFQGANKMAHVTPTVRQGILHRSDSPGPGILVGAPAWYIWLSQATTFSFVDDEETFTARKQRFQRGGWYWKAYRKRNGRLYCAYLGKPEHLNLERLKYAAHLLSERCQSQVQSRTTEPNRNLEHGKASSVALQTSKAEPAPIAALMTLKTTIPPLPSGLVPRERLTDRLTTLVQGQLTLLLAQAGWGKTTLLSAWSRCSPYRVTWLTLERSDNDPSRFWMAFIAALERVETGVGRESLPLLLQTGQSNACETALTYVIRALLPIQHDIVLILDDYHLIVHPDILQGLLFLLEHMPPSLHLVLSSRTTPTLPLARLHVKYRVGELHSTDLRFTREEIAAFFRKTDQRELSSATLTALEDRSEGWIAGLHLASKAAQGELDPDHVLSTWSGTQRAILTYLLEEVFEQQPEHLQSLLLSTCLLDRFNEALCQSLTTGETHGLLEQLEQAHLFILPDDKQAGWYRYQHLFAQALRQHLRRTSPELIPILHMQASCWFEAHGLIEEAVRHAIEAHGFERAAQLIERIAPMLVARGELSALRNWLSALPTDMLHANPRLCLSMAWSLMFTAQLETFAFWVDSAERALRLYPQTLAQDQIILLQDEIAALRTLLMNAHQDYAPAIVACEEILEHHEKESRHLYSLALLSMGMAYTERNVSKAAQSFVEANRNLKMVEHTLLQVSTLANQAGLYIIQGQPFQAATFYKHIGAHAHGPHGYLALAEGLAYLGLGYLAWEWNDLATARHHFMQTWNMSRETETIQVMAANSAFFLSQLAQAQGDAEAADGWLQQIEAICQKIHCVELLEQASLCRIRHLLARGQAEEALLYMQTRYPQLAHMADGRDDFATLTLARVLIAATRFRCDPSSVRQAYTLLETMRLAVEQAGKRRSLIEVLALQALSLDLLQDLPNALTVLAQAVALAEPGRYVRLFVGEGEPMERLLRLLLREEKSKKTSPVNVTYLRNLIQAFVHPENPPLLTSSTGGQTLLDPLSEREREVLHLMAAGRKNREIADELVVVTGTVKAHINSIYRKLAVNSRVQAVARARTLQLL